MLITTYKWIASKEISTDKCNQNVILKGLRKKNLGKLIIGHLNINSIRNKFGSFKFLDKTKY